MKSAEILMRKYHYGYNRAVNLLSDPYVIDLIKENNHNRKVINKLSRKIQRKNQEYKKLKVKKMPPTLYGREVIIVPDSMVKDIMLVNKDIFDVGGVIK